MLSEGKPVKLTATLTPLEPELEETMMEQVTVEPVPLSTRLCVSELCCAKRTLEQGLQFVLGRTAT